MGKATHYKHYVLYFTPITVVTITGEKALVLLIKKEIELQSMISEAFTQSRDSAGARTLSDMIYHSDGIRYSRYIINKRMRLIGLISKQALIHKYSLADTEHVDIPNYLDRQFAVTEPSQVWVGDVTHIWTSQGWSYLAVVMDLFARKPIGWAMSKLV